MRGDAWAFDPFALCYFYSQNPPIPEGFFPRLPPMAPGEGPCPQWEDQDPGATTHVMEWR